MTFIRQQETHFQSALRQGSKRFAGTVTESRACLDGVVFQGWPHVSRMLGEMAKDHVIYLTE